MHRLPSGVYLRGAVYQIRVLIPMDLQAQFPRTKGGKLSTAAYRASLGTTDPAEATIRAHRILAEWRARFEGMRAQAQARYVEPGPGLIEHIAEQARHRVLATDDTIRSSPKAAAMLAGINRTPAPSFFSPHDKTLRQVLTGASVRAAVSAAEDHSFLTRAHAESLADWYSRVTAALRQAMIQGDYRAARDEAKRVCDSLGVPVDWESPKRVGDLQRIMRTIVSAWMDASARSQGEPIDTPEAPAYAQEFPATQPDHAATLADAPAPEASPKRVGDLLPDWIRLNSPKPDAVKRIDRPLALWREATGDPELSSITRKTGATFIAYLLDTESRGFGRKSAHTYAAGINALLNVAEKQGYIERNPCSLLDFDKTPGAGKRTPWTDDQLAKIFGAALFRDMENSPEWRGVPSEDGRALLLLLLHTGARIGEVAQARCQDFVIRSGLECIEINAEAGTVKTDTSERVIPIATHLLNDPWFRQWLDAVKARATGPAMPGFHRGPKTPPGEVAMEWLREFRAHNGLPPGKLNGSHKFRHWISTALAEVGISPRISDAVTGHSARGSTGQRTYVTVTLPMMADALGTIRWPALPS
ncbi:DUF6538 domain-containing protein [Bordetella genomosp. 10]|nr:DUF6538 domain-containing protein [Bordetella genomosp. 10]